MKSLETVQEAPSDNETEVKNILTKEEGLVFVVPRSFELPEEYNFNALEGIGVSAADLEDVVGSFINYLKTPLVIDQKYVAGNEEERQKRRKELAFKYGRIAGNLILHNKLRHNRIASIQSFFERWIIRSGLPQLKNWPHAAKIKELYDKFPPDSFGGAYFEASFPRKLEIVETIENIIAEFLKLIGNKEST